MKKDKNLMISNHRTTTWEDFGITINEYSEVRKGWNIPFARMNIKDDNLEITFDGAGGDLTIKTPTTKKKFPIKLKGDYETINLNTVGALHQSDDQYVADLYVGCNRHMFLSAVMDGKDKNILCYVMRFDTECEMSLEMEYDKHTGGFKLIIPTKRDDSKPDQ